MQAFAYDEYSKINRDGKDEKIVQGDYYWVEVEKVKFIRLKDNSGKEYALCEQPLFSGIQLDLQQDYEKHNYKENEKIDMSKHNLGRYLNNHFAKDIAQGVTKEQPKDGERYWDPRVWRRRPVTQDTPKHLIGRGDYPEPQSER